MVKPLLKTALASILWPLLLSASLAIVYLGFRLDSEIIFYNIAYFSLAGTLFLLERVFPYRRDWLESDGQVLPDLAHTVLTKSLVQIIIVLITITGLVALLRELPGGGWWPTQWPTLAQVIVAMVVGEFGLYWAHRLAHTYDLLWRFHAVHHSVEKLWFFNTGRFHFVDTLLSLCLGLPILMVIGVPGHVLIWVSAVTSFIGFLTHCNVYMRCGPLNYIFNTPNVHRWHHSRKIHEGNSNYGENLMLWDILFRTYYFPAKQEVAAIGIDDFMPAKFIHQLKTPFLWKEAQASKPYPPMKQLSKKDTSKVPNDTE